MKVLMEYTITGWFDDKDEQWKARRAFCLNHMKNKAGKEGTYVTIEKLTSDVRLPDGEFNPLYDRSGRIAGFTK